MPQPDLLLNNYVADLKMHYPFLAQLQFDYQPGNADYASRIRMLAPQIEGLYKQYKHLKEFGKIDQHLIEIDNSVIDPREVKSLVHNKYVRSNTKEFSNGLHLLFSEDSANAVVDPHTGHTITLYNQLRKSLLTDEDIKNYQLFGFELLLGLGLLVRTPSGFKRAVDSEQFWGMLYHLWEFGIIPFWYSNEESKRYFLNLETHNHIAFDDTLLASQEADYSDYYMNNKTFTNGPSIRNTYLHGGAALNKEMQKSHYLVVQNLAILTLVKIHDDLLTLSAFKHFVDKYKKQHTMAG